MSSEPPVPDELRERAEAVRAEAQATRSEAVAAQLADVPAEPGVRKPDPILAVDGVARRFGGLQAVCVDHLEIQRGAITSLIGPNGAGKSTFFNVVSGFDRPNAGTWSFDGRELAGLPAYRVSRLGLVRTFQLTKALMRLTALENLMLGAPEQRGERLRSSILRGLWRSQENGIRERADELLTRFNLAHMRDEYAGTMSGGQRKLLEMARALMTEPAMLMLDEPMAGVNPALTQSLLGHIRAMRDDGMTIVLVEHDMDVVMGISDWVVCFAAGEVIAEGRPQDIAANPAVIEAYLGAREDEEDAAHPHAARAAGSATAEVEPAGEPAGPAPVLCCEQLVAGYIPEVNILNGCDVEVRDGELVGIIGPNGAGKSTLIKAMFGLVPTRDGRVKLREEDVTHLRAHAMVPKGIGYVPQNDNVFSTLTVEENLQMGLYVRPHEFEERYEIVSELFPLLRDRRTQKCGSLSGGERQVVAMGRALMADPQVLLLDEPSAGLSPMMQDTVFEAIERINGAGVSILMVEQNASRCLEISDRAYVLDQGRNAYTGTGEELLNDPKVIELYLGTLARQR